MPGVVAGRLGVKGTMVIEGPALDSDAHSGLNVDSIDDAMMARATAPRGGLGTILKVSPSSGGWLKQRNPLLRDVAFPAAGKVKVLVCEGGVCREEGLEEGGLQEGMQAMGLGEGHVEAGAESGAVGEAIVPETVEPGETAS